ncbi:hypothetical protein DAEQUDRAFT_768681 [Daedalea quercina L-15889]|uniref:Family A G protein-coupled receptor-like protein n=1 Tax=Daedalea quercina L-15889 TaxID=1314783 RepID=A0A165MFM1_9APHY|nr:hypothetical protein DAEQUDRAFT_768681 [Daedalea quercina L-15889]
MADRVSLVSANLVTVGIESFLYGIVFLLSLTFSYLHVSRAVGSNSTYGRARLSRIVTPIFVGTVFVFSTCTTHWCLTMTRLFQAFVIYEGGAAPLLFYASLSEPTEVAKTAVVIATLIGADIMIAYRMWIVWGKNWYVVIVPMLTVLGLCVSGIGIVVTLAGLNDGETVFVTSAAHWITADYATTFVTNIYSSAMIAFKVWKADRNTGKSYGGGNLKRVLATIIESAGIYTIYVVVFFAAYESDSNLQFTFVDTLCQVAGISFMMINVRVGLGWADTGNNISQASSGGFQPRRNLDQSYVMRPVAVDISTVVYKDDDLSQPTTKGDLPEQYRAV